MDGGPKNVVLKPRFSHKWQAGGAEQAHDAPPQRTIPRKLTIPVSGRAEGGRRLVSLKAAAGPARALSAAARQVRRTTADGRPARRPILQPRGFVKVSLASRPTAQATAEPWEVRRLNEAEAQSFLPSFPPLTARPPSPGSPVSVGSSVIADVADPPQRPAASPLQSRAEIAHGHPLTPALSPRLAPGDLMARRPPQSASAGMTQRLIPTRRTRATVRHVSRRPLGGVVAAAITAAQSINSVEEPVKRRVPSQDVEEPALRKKRRTMRSRGTGMTEPNMPIPVQRPAVVRRPSAASGSTASPPSEAGPESSDFTEAEKQELKAAVLAQLEGAICAPGEEAMVLAEFVSVLVEQHKSKEEMTKELNVYVNDKAEPFVAWVQECCVRILARRHNAKAERSNRRRAAVVASGGSSSESGSVSGTGKDSPLTTLRQAALAARQNARANAAASPQPRAAVDPAVQSTNERRRMELLAEMTKRLQEILSKLADKTLDDAGREKYQAMAQTIQAKLTELSGMGRPSARAAAA